MASTIPETPLSATPWLTVAQAMAHLQLKSPKLIYRAVASRKMRAAKLGSRALRFKQAWLDEFLENTSEPVEIRPR